ncbi:MAG: glycosyltransferase family protein [Bacteroidota bacterium]|nr:glycosyltransferase family protein [Bacteroidota bacterium]
MRFLFIVQGEGRGHMTQAISMRDILVRNGHEVLEVLVGKSRVREIPRFFFDKIEVPVHTYESPNFAVSHNNKGIHVYQSILRNLFRLNVYFKSLAFINRKIKDLKPDVVINFYEMLGGFTWMFYRPKVKYICIGHQFLLLHPGFVFPSGRHFQIWMLNFLTRLTSFGADKQLALSFVSMPDLRKKKIFVVPPLLRNEVRELIPHNGNYILGYMLNAGYSEEIIRWHKTCPQQEAHFFWDKKDVPEDLEVEPNLWFHRINDVKFLQYMKDCKGYASTAGFESICEAMYLRKPVLMVPTAGHIEQRCNSVDGVRAGAGITSDAFDLDKLIDFIPTFNNADQTFVHWEQQAEDRFLTLLTQ